MDINALAVFSQFHLIQATRTFKIPGMQQWNNRAEMHPMVPNGIVKRIYHKEINPVEIIMRVSRKKCNFLISILYRILRQLVTQRGKCIKTYNVENKTQRERRTHHYAIRKLFFERRRLPLHIQVTQTGTLSSWYTIALGIQGAIIYSPLRDSILYTITDTCFLFFHSW